MRVLLALCLTLLPTAETLSADKPIPQDTARMEKRRRDWLDWNRRTLAGAYEKVGEKDPKWDKAVHETLELAARMFSQQVDPILTFDNIAKPAQAAIDAGCRDPLIGFLYARTLPQTNDAQIRRFKEAVKTFATSRYPAWRRAAALTISVPGKLQPGPEGDVFRKESQAAFDGALALLSESVATDEHNEFWESWTHPVDNVARSKFATFCQMSGHYREAEVQYVALGDQLTQWSEFPYVPLNQLKQHRERNARIVLGKEGRITFPGWHFVGGTNEDGQWFVSIPVGAPHQQKPGILGADASHVWNCSTDGITYGIRVLRLPPALRNDSPERVLEAARSVVAKERGAQPRNLRDTLLAARTAQEYDVDASGLKPMQLRVKTIVIGTWLYELSVTASKSDVTGRAAREFFDSFAFQPKAKPSVDASEP
jgi:hypothetical protein